MMQLSARTVLLSTRELYYFIQRARKVIWSLSIIGEDKALSIKFGAEANDPSGEDVILIRGASADVNRATKEIHKIVEDAKNDEIVSSYVCAAVISVSPFVDLQVFQSTEFEIDRDYVGHVVGAQGASVKRLRDALGVKVDFQDESDDKEEKTVKKKKATHQKVKVKVHERVSVIQKEILILDVPDCRP